jgi:positive regulator of sigma E activity
MSDRDEVSHEERFFQKQETNQVTDSDGGRILEASEKKCACGENKAQQTCLKKNFVDVVAAAVARICYAKNYRVG